MKNIKKVYHNGKLPQFKCTITFSSCGPKMALYFIYFTAALMGKAKLSPPVRAAKVFFLTQIVVPPTRFRPEKLVLYAFGGETQKRHLL